MRSDNVIVARDTLRKPKRPGSMDLASHEVAASDQLGLYRSERFVFLPLFKSSSMYRIVVIASHEAGWDHRRSLCGP